MCGFIQGTHALTATYQKDNGTVFWPTEFLAQTVSVAGRLAETIGDWQADHLYLLLAQARFNRPAPGFCGGHQAEIGLRAVPQGMCGHQVGHHSDKARPVTSQGAQYRRICQGMNRNNQIAGVLGNQSAQCTAHVRPGAGHHQLGAPVAVANAVPQPPKLRYAHHMRIKGGDAVEGRRGVIFKDIHHLGRVGIAKLKPYGFDDCLCSRPVPPTRV